MMTRLVRRKKSGGFTLIELMIVIAIIAILAAILVPNFIRARAQGQFTACKSNLKNIATALEMYSTDSQGRYPTKLSKLSDNQKYLRTIPTCASAGSDTYSSSGYTSASNPDAYTIYCVGKNHSAVDAAENFPQYNSVAGLLEK
ncbi:MAG: competence type IV pilus major pilin ComGC [Candidatus Xenobium sp.]|nr:type II secretion system protein [Burkholderiales bacterium]